MSATGLLKQISAKHKPAVTVSGDKDTVYIRITCKNRDSDKINDKCEHMNFVVGGNVYMCVCIYIHI